MSMRTPKLAVRLVVIVALLTPGCAGRDEALAKRQATELEQALRSAPADVDRDRDRGALWKTMQTFYQARGFEPAWIDGTRPTSRLAALVRALGEAREHGIDPERYDVEEIARPRAGAQQGLFRRDRLDEQAVVPLDVKATWAWIQYAADLSAGAVDVEGPADKMFRLRRHKIDFPSRLSASLENGSIEEDLRACAPSHPDYVRLKQAFAQYESIVEAGGWRALPAKLTLKPGDRSPHVAALAERLAASGDLESGGRWWPSSSDRRDSDVFDAGLSTAVARFQRRHGLEPDGAVGPRVVAELNVPADRRLRQIAVNLERWRWLPRDLGDRYIFVNIPEYRLEVREKDRATLAMNVIVGATGTPTPIFSDTLTHIVFSPYWNVPDSIAAGETLPAVQSDPSFLDRNRIEVVGTSGQVLDPSTIDWTSMSTEDGGELQYRFRQRPGASNSLGLVKFVFPNEYDVYLHDTPADALFKRAYRAMSHGCIRVEQPVALAEYLLRDQPEWTSDRIDAAMHAGQEQHVKLARPIPVHLMYWTVRVADAGAVHFRQDVYERDAREIGALMALRMGRRTSPRAAE
jgi:murein L,D-transpeptidase YcbB/YkuD